MAYDPRVLEEAALAAERNETLREAAEELNLPYSTFYDRYQAAIEEGLTGAESSKNDGSRVQEKFEKDHSGDCQKIHSIGSEIRTVAQAMAKAEIDEDVWEVDRYKINSWEVAGKQGDGSFRKCPLWQVTVWLKRKISKPHVDAIEAFERRIANYAPKYEKIERPKKSGSPHMLELALFDVHFGKLAWNRETNNDYDLSIAQEIFANAVDDLIAKTAHYNIDKILLPIGQDFLHVDDMRGMTYSGTPQDMDSRFAKVFETAEIAVQEAIEKCRQIAPTKVTWVPGNHDRQTSWYLCRVMRGTFTHADDVEFDVEPTVRKYEKYGKTLLGYTHGNEEKHSSLPTIMATEEKRKWADTTHHEWHIGHWHKKKQTNYTPVDTYDGVVVRVIPSLCGTDAWHYMKGYIGGTRAAEAYLWSHTDGYSGHFSSNLIESVPA